MQSPIQSLLPQSVLGWSSGSGSASSDNRSTPVRTPSQHQFAFDGYFTLTFSLTPPACRQTESRKKARGADPQRGRPVYPDRDDKDLSLLELRLEWSRNPGEILNQWILSQECSIRTRGQGRFHLIFRVIIGGYSDLWYSCLLTWPDLMIIISLIALGVSTWRAIREGA